MKRSGKQHPCSFHRRAGDALAVALAGLLAVILTPTVEAGGATLEIAVSQLAR